MQWVSHLHGLAAAEEAGAHLSGGEGGAGREGQEQNKL